MKAPALVAVDQPPESFSELFSFARRQGLRIGWLDLTLRADAPPAPAVDAGAFKGVVVGEGRVVATKRIAGETVLRDLLREHFVGCAVVLVRGHQAEPRLRTENGEWSLDEAGAARAYSIEALLRRLLRPRYRA